MPKDGNVVRITQFRWDSNSPINLATPHIWGKVLDGPVLRNDGFDFVYICGGNKQFAADIVHDTDILFSNSFDQCVVVSPSKWPDEVCVALATRALLNEGDDR